MERDGGGRPAFGSLRNNQLPALGSTSKDQPSWQRKPGIAARTRFHPGSTTSPGASRKKVEGSLMLLQQEEVSPTAASAGQQQQEQEASNTGRRLGACFKSLGPSSARQQSATGSRIPRPPAANAAATREPAASGAIPCGFQTYSNPSFTGGDGMADEVLENSAPACAITTAKLSSTASPAGLAAAAACLHPGETQKGGAKQQPAPLPDARPWRAYGQPRQRAGPGTSTASVPLPMQTPEALKVLQHLNQDSPVVAEGGRKGIQGIMNAYLRTGPQMLSPESCSDMVIRAPGAEAVPAQGLMAVAGRGGAGVYGMVNTFLRTGAAALSPEPGYEATLGADSSVAAQQGPPQAQLAQLAQLYSPASPLAPTPLPPAAATAECSAFGSIAPASVCSNAGSSCRSSCAMDSISLGQAFVPQLQFKNPKQEEGVSGATNLSVPGKDEEEGQELPTARTSPVQGRPLQARARRDGPPSPISFVLPGDACAIPAQATQAGAVVAHADSPTFSFGMGPAVEVPPTAAQLPAKEKKQLPAGSAALQQAADEVAVPQHIHSNETVQGPNPFKAMLRHLHGPTYASPAPANLPRCDSPQSPQHLTPLHLISEGHDTSSPSLPAVTPELGVGSLTVWIKRRGTLAILTTPMHNDLRKLWAAAAHNSRISLEAEAVREENAVLAAEVEALQAQMTALGLQHEQALAAANAGALCAESEVARAQEAACQMMQLAEQIQQTFQLCEAEKVALVAELQAAQGALVQHDENVTQTKAGADEPQAAEMQEELEAARKAVLEAEQAAAAAHVRAVSASAELAAVKAQLEQVAVMEADRQMEQADSQLAVQNAGLDASLLANLCGQLSTLHHTLCRLLAEQDNWRGDGTPALRSMLGKSERQLDLVNALLGDDHGVLAANTALRMKVEQMRSVLASCSPGSGHGRSGTHAGLFGSPVPFSLQRARGRSCSEASKTPGTVSDVFGSPSLPSRTTLTVDYRLFGSRADSAASGDASSSPGVSQASPTSQQAMSSPVPQEEVEPECTVIHNGMVITNVPASEVSRVRCMVQYWEAVANGEDPAPATDGDAEAAASMEADAQAFAAAAVEAARAAVAAQEAAAAEAEAAAEMAAVQEEASTVAVIPEAAEGALPQGECAASPLRTTPIHFAAPSAAPAVLPCTTTPASVAATLTITPISYSALRRFSGGKAQEEVRSRLQRLKADLQAAQAKLHTVDKGLAAIAYTPTSTTSCASAATPSSAGASWRQLASTCPDSVQQRSPASQPKGGARVPGILASPGRSLPAVALRAAGTQALSPAVTPLHLPSDSQAWLAPVQEALPDPAPSVPALVSHPIDNLTPSPSLSAAAGATQSLAEPPSAEVWAESVQLDGNGDWPVAAGHAPTWAVVGEQASRSIRAAGKELHAAQAAVSMPAGMPTSSNARTAAGSSPAALRAEATENHAANLQPASTGMAFNSSVKRSVKCTAQPASGAHRPESHAALASVMGSAAVTPSPQVGSNRRTPQAVGSALRLSPAALQSANKANSVKRLSRRMSLAASDSEDAEPSSEDEMQDDFDYSRMAVGMKAAASSPASGANARAPLGRGGGAQPDTPGLSTTSFSPPEPLALLAIKPLGRVRRAGVGSRGRRPSESEEREFRRRAAALQIHISPYWRAK